MKSQPALELPKSALERWLDAASWIFVVLGWAWATGFYQALPEQIPTHFNATGIPDGFGSKITVFLLPVLSLVIVGGLTFLARKPHHFNYPFVVTPENAAFEYRKARTILRVMNALVSLMFMLITWHTVRASTGGPDRLGLWFGALVALTLIVPLALFFGWRDKSVR